MKQGELEKQLNFKYPERWNDIYETGAMEWLESERKKLKWEEFSAKMQKYINDPKQFLMMDGCDIEPIMFEDTAKWLDTLNELISWKTADEGLKLKNGVNLFPFATNGGGDIFCFLYEENIDESKIALYFHDDYDTPEIYANSFDEFLYTAILEAADFEGDIDPERLKNHIDFMNDKYKDLIKEKTIGEMADEYESMVFEKADIWERI